MARRKLTKEQQARVNAASHSPEANAKRRATRARTLKLKRMAVKDAAWEPSNKKASRVNAVAPRSKLLDPEERAMWITLVGLLNDALGR